MSLNTQLGINANNQPLGANRSQLQHANTPSVPTTLIFFFFLTDLPRLSAPNHQTLCIQTLFNIQKDKGPPVRRIHPP